MPESSVDDCNETFNKPMPTSRFSTLSILASTQSLKSLNILASVKKVQFRVDYSNCVIISNQIGKSVTTTRKQRSEVVQKRDIVVFDQDCSGIVLTL